MHQLGFESQVLPMVILCLTVSLVVLAVGCILWRMLRSPFSYPYFNLYFDVSGKRKPKMENLIDDHLNETRLEDIERHLETVGLWEIACKEKVEKSVLKKRRAQQFEKCRDDEHAFRFHQTRQQTRYKQKNYVKESYKVVVEEKCFACSYAYLIDRYKQLEEIQHECSLNEYHRKDQRSRMTKELREEIIQRDNYTCQRCGKYMPDKVGLQIDHIVPVSKGGKTVPSNLQVLCSVCNGSKSDKM